VATTIPGEIQSYCFAMDNGLLQASWSDELRSESEEFYASVQHLLALITQQQVTRLLLDSGKPDGGILTEEVTSYILKHTPFTKLEKVALLESQDFHWDNNIIQLASYLKQSTLVSFEFRTFSIKTNALEWLAAAKTER
jgi:hypothetical protein